MEKASRSSQKIEKDTITKLFDRAKAFTKQHKKLSIIIGVVAIFVIYDIVHSISVSIENGKDFYINIQDEFSFDCEATDSDDGLAYCRERTIEGTFSNYDTVRFDKEYSKFATSGDKFTYKVTAPIKSELYQTDDFDSSSLPREFDADKTIELYDRVLVKIVAMKIVTVHYTLTDSDIQAINNLHDKWAAEKAQEEAEKNAETEENQEATPQESEEAPAAPAQEQEDTSKQDAGEELPDDISPYDMQALCERGFESLGYTNAKISITNHYPMGYPPYVYVIVGTLSTKSGLLSSRQQVGTVQCQANWNTWTVKSLMINGTQVY